MPGLIRIQMFGTFQVEVDGRAVGFSRRKSEALLAYLALYPGEHTRERLANQFWGDSQLEAARHALRVIISDLKKSLGPDVLSGGRDTLELKPTMLLWVDAFAVQELAHSSLPADWQAALALCSGEFLPEAYEEWAQEWRADMTRLRSGLLLRLVEYLRAQAEYEQAIQLARRLLALDPADETAHQHIMVCYEALGDRSAALRQYSECAGNLLDQLGVVPSAATEAIRQRLEKARARPALRTQATNIPTQLTSFIGREAELEAVESLLSPLAHGAHPARLVTLTGAGGSGKTRLAVQAAAELADTFPDGAWLVELAALSRGDDVARQVARVFSVNETTIESLETSVLAALTGRTFLLVLDNCEHLLEACSALTRRILETCPGAQVLTTSREGLGIPGEQLFPVPTLDVPPDPATNPAGALKSDSVRLFVERARLVQPGFNLDSSNLPAVLSILRRLDGIPLAIELAAARVKLLSPGEIAARLDDRFRLLVSSDRAILPRQKTLGALIDWSYELLTRDERLLFCRLSVYPGGCTLESAGALGAGLDLTVMDLLMHLVDKSLLMVKRSPAGTRYQMLDTIRYFAAERLAASGESALAPAQAVAYMIKLVDREYTALGENNDFSRLPILVAEHDNLRALLVWALEHDPAQAVYLAGGLWPFWHLTSQCLEGDQFLREALQKGAGLVDMACLARATSGAGTMAYKLGDFERARQMHEISATLYHQVGDKRGEVFSRYNTILQVFYQKEYSATEEMLRVVLEKARAIQFTLVVQYSLNMLGIITTYKSDFAAARLYYNEFLALCRENNDPVSILIVYHNLGELSYREGDLQAALSYYNKSIELDKENFAAAENYIFISRVHIALRDYLSALRTGQTGLEAAHRQGDKRLLVDGLESLVQSLAAWQVPTQAVYFAAAAANLRQSLTYQVKIDPGYQTTLAVVEDLRARLAPPDFEAAWQAGWSDPLEQVISSALKLKW